VSSMVCTIPVSAVIRPVALGSKSVGIRERKSRYTAGTTILSPSAGCMHMNPGSILQPAVQPSPSTLLPSSHASLTTMPSPQRDMHAPFAAVLQSGSFWQVAEQPSNGSALPSSQPSAPSTFLSPQVVCEHVLGLPLHFQPISILQVSEQPSPAVVLSSSHSSGSTATPSPQRAMRWQGCPAGVQENPGSTVRQLAAQPSSAVVLWSSHASSWLRTPSPHSECGGTIVRSAVTMSSAGEPSLGPTAASLPPVPAVPAGVDWGLTPAQAPSEVQPATIKRRNTVDRIRNSRVCPGFPLPRKAIPGNRAVLGEANH